MELSRLTVGGLHWRRARHLVSCAMACLVLAGCGIFEGDCNVGPSLDVSPASATLSVGEVFIPTQVRVGRDCDAAALEPTELTWSTADSTVVAIQQDSGLPLGVSPGKTAVTAQHDYMGQRLSALIQFEVRSP